MNPNELKNLFVNRYGRSPNLIVRAPGRVNILGEHVDYNDGFVLPAAINRAIYLAVSSNENDMVSLYACDFDQKVTFSFDDLAQKQDMYGNALFHWALYPAGVAWALREVGFNPIGIDAVIMSEIPIGAGLSSSAALEVGFCSAWQALGGWDLDRMRLALLCQRAENEYVGLSCGIMDQFASACGVEGHALFFDTRNLQWEPAPLPSGIALVIADSGIRRSLTSSGYNDRRTSCEQAVEELKKYLPGIHSLRDVQSTEFAAFSDYLPEIPRKRAEHVIKEIARVKSALSALQREDKQALGALLYAGHRSLRDLYEVSTPELDTLVDLTRSIPGCIGARLTGGGFGGCTINLVEINQAENFIQELKKGYYRETGRDAPVYLCDASQGATVERC